MARMSPLKDGIAQYYERKRMEAEEVSLALEKAKKENASSYEELRRLEQALEQARYVGD